MAQESVNTSMLSILHSHFLNEGNKAISAEGNHTVAVLKVKEDYEGLKSELRDLITEVHSLDSLVCSGVRYNISWFLGGDWKFLATVCGIGAAISKYPCIWCECPKASLYDASKEWSLTDIRKGARTVQSITNLAK